MHAAQIAAGRRSMFARDEAARREEEEDYDDEEAEGLFAEVAQESEESEADGDEGEEEDGADEQEDEDSDNGSDDEEEEDDEDNDGDGDGDEETHEGEAAEPREAQPAVAADNDTRASTLSAPLLEESLVRFSRAALLCRAFVSTPCGPLLVLNCSLTVPLACPRHASCLIPLRPPLLRTADDAGLVSGRPVVPGRSKAGP